MFILDSVLWRQSFLHIVLDNIIQVMARYISMNILNVYSWGDSLEVSKDGIQQLKNFESLNDKK